MLSLHHIHRSFGDLEAVKDLSLTVEPGEILGFLGPNGAGKTTTIRMICGLLEPDSGRIEWAGLEGHRSHSIGLCPQENVHWPKLTCLEQLVFSARSYGLEGDQLAVRANALLGELGLGAKRDTLAKDLSGGMKRRLNIALALMHDPPLLILDEPEAGLDPQSRILIRDLIRSQAQEKTVILTTHNMDEAERLADRVAIMDHGELLQLDTVEALKASVGVVEMLDLTFDKSPSEKVKNDLTKLGLQVEGNGLGLVLKGRDLAGRLAEIQKVLGDERPQRMQLREPCLEDVFIQLTGRGLRS